MGTRRVFGSVHGFGFFLLSNKIPARPSATIPTGRVRERKLLVCFMLIFNSREPAFGFDQATIP